MATQCTSNAFPLAGLGRRHVVAKFDGGRLSSDGGAVLLRAANQAFQVTGRLAACFIDHRNPARVEHSLESLLGQRVFALALVLYFTLLRQNSSDYSDGRPRNFLD